MKQKNESVKIGVIFCLLLLTIGFALVSTNLMINGNILIGTNEEDFDVIFTKSVIDGINKTSESISEDGKTLTFQTKDLSKLGDKSILDFEVTNNSSQYDANITMNCKTNGSKTEYYTITNTIPNQIEAKSKAIGKVSVVLDKVSTENITETFTCTLDVDVEERTEIATLYNPCDTSTICRNFIDNDLDRTISIGDKITFDTESFYIISNDTNSIRLLSEYNLEVGGNYDGTWVAIENPTGLQNSAMVGYGATPRKGVTPFSTTDTTYAGSIVETYVNDYKLKLENIGLNVKDATLITIEELDALGCESKKLTCVNAPAFVTNSSYWTRSYQDERHIWTVSSDRYYTNDYPNSYGNRFGVRPVIVISVEDI